MGTRFFFVGESAVYRMNCASCIESHSFSRLIGELECIEMYWDIPEIWSDDVRFWSNHGGGRHWCRAWLSWIASMIGVCLEHVEMHWDSAQGGRDNISLKSNHGSSSGATGDAIAALSWCQEYLVCDVALVFSQCGVCTLDEEGNYEQNRECKDALLHIHTRWWSCFLPRVRSLSRVGYVSQWYTINACGFCEQFSWTTE